MLNRRKLDAKSRHVTFVGYSETEKKFRVFDRDRRKVLVSCNIKFKETETTPIAEELYVEQGIVNDYKNDVEIESPSTQEEILKTQEPQDSLTFEIPRRSKRERKQPDWLSYWSMAEFAYSMVIGTPLTFDEAIESSDKKWQLSMDEEIDAHQRNKTWKLVPRPDEKSVIDNKWI